MILLINLTMASLVLQMKTKKKLIIFANFSSKQNSNFLINVAESRTWRIANFNIISNWFCWLCAFEMMSWFFFYKVEVVSVVIWGFHIHFSFSGFRNYGNFEGLLGGSIYFNFCVEILIFWISLRRRSWCLQFLENTLGIPEKYPRNATYITTHPQIGSKGLIRKTAHKNQPHFWNPRESLYIIS